MSKIRAMAGTHKILPATRFANQNKKSKENNYEKVESNNYGHRNGQAVV